MSANPSDHSVLGRALDFFDTAPSVGAGLPLWLPDGAVVRSELERLALEQALGLDGLGPDLVVGDRDLGLVVERRVRRPAVVLLRDGGVGGLGDGERTYDLQSVHGAGEQFVVVPAARLGLA